MKETGIVESIDENNAVVCVVRRTACGDSCKNCAGGCKLTKNRVTAANEINAKCGDIVDVEAETSMVLKSAFVVYILPLIVFFSAYFITDGLIKNEGFAVIISLVLFALVFFVLHFLDKKNKFKTKMKITGVVKEKK